MKKFFALLLVLTAMLAFTPKAEAGPRIAVNLNIPFGGIAVGYGAGYCAPVYRDCQGYRIRPEAYVPQPMVVERPVFVDRPIVVERPYVVETPSVNQQVLQVHAVLKNKGYYTKIVDGVFGQETQIAIRNYQLDRGLPLTGRIDATLVNDLGL